MWFSTLVVGWALTLAGTSPATLIVLEKDAGPLVEHFNARTGQPRFLAILSPT